MRLASMNDALLLRLRHRHSSHFERSKCRSDAFYILLILVARIQTKENHFKFIVYILIQRSLNGFSFRIYTINTENFSLGNVLSGPA